ncbi:rI lysis inhibition regulator [Shigella phage JK32]|nr:rI lysis inhibition regulator [Shigella phage JK32]
MSFIRKTLVAGICVMAVGSVSADQCPVGDFTDYFDGAMIVYINKIQPSVETSQKFHDHIMKTYARSKCMDAKHCFMMGEYAANQFIVLNKMENRYNEIQ